MKTAKWTVCALMILTAVAFLDTNAFAQETFNDSFIEFTAPPAGLDPDTLYEFEFTVYNMSTYDPLVKGEWIYMVDLTMPSDDYNVDEMSLVAPTPLHGDPGEGEYRILNWEVAFHAPYATITWQCVDAMPHPAFHVGDIREGESLDFGFIATTDAAPSNCFQWVLYSDEGSTLEGSCPNFPPADDDDDDSGEDDDDSPDEDDTGDDDDDDNDGGCGC